MDREWYHFPKGVFKAAWIAWKNLFRKNITIQYPNEYYELPERARWSVLMKHDENGNHKCTGCGICEKTCPDYIINIKTSMTEDKQKMIDSYQYQIGACMMCGLCVEACPFDAIEMGKDYELAYYDHDDITQTLLKDVPVAKPPRKERPAPAPKPAAAESGAQAPAQEAPAVQPSAADDTKKED